MKQILLNIGKLGAGTVSVGGVVAATSVAYVNVSKDKEEKESNIISNKEINVQFDGQLWTNTNDLKKHINEITDKEYEYVDKTHIFTLTIGGKNINFDSADAAQDFLIANNMKFKEVYLSANYKNFIDPISNELKNTSYVAQEKNEDLYNLYKKSDGSYSLAKSGESYAKENDDALEEALKSYLQVHNAYYFDEIYFRTKQDVESYIRRKISEGDPSNRYMFERFGQTYNLIMQNGTTQSFSNINGKAFENFISENSTPYFVADDGTSFEFKRENFSNIQNYIKTDDFDYINIQTNNGKITEYIDLDATTPNGNLTGPYFVDSGKGLDPMKNHRNWHQEKFSEVSKNFSDDFEPFNLFLERLMLAALPSGTNETTESYLGPFYDLLSTHRFFSNLRSRNYTILDYIKEIPNNPTYSNFNKIYQEAIKGKNFKTYNALILSYKFIINSLIDTKAEVPVIKEVGKAFQTIAKLLDRQLTIHLGEFIAGHNLPDGLEYFQKIFQFHKLNFQVNYDYYYRELQGQQSNDKINWLIFKLIKVYIGIQTYILQESEIADNAVGELIESFYAKEMLRFAYYHLKLYDFKYNKIESQYIPRSNDKSNTLIWQHLENEWDNQTTAISIGNVDVAKITSNIANIVDGINTAFEDAANQFNEIVMKELRKYGESYEYYPKDGKYYLYNYYGANPPTLSDATLDIFLKNRRFLSFVDKHKLNTNTLGYVDGEWNLINHNPVGVIRDEMNQVAEQIFEMLKSTSDLLGAIKDLKEVWKTFNKFFKAVPYLGFALEFLDFAIAAFVPKVERGIYKYASEGSEFLWDGYQKKTMLFGMVKLNGNYTIDQLKLINPLKVNSAYLKDGYYIDGDIVDSFRSIEAEYVSDFFEEINYNRKENYDKKIPNIAWKLKLENINLPTLFSTQSEIAKQLRAPGVLAMASQPVYSLTTGQLSDDANNALEDKIKSLITSLKPIYIFKIPERDESSIGDFKRGSFTYPRPLYNNGEVENELVEPTSSSTTAEKMLYEEYIKRKSKLIIYNTNINLDNIRSTDPLYRFYELMSNTEVNSLIKRGYSWLMQNIPIKKKTVTFRDLNNSVISNINSYEDINPAPNLSKLFYFVDRYGVQKYFNLSNDLMNYALRKDQFNLSSHQSSRKTLKYYYIKLKEYEGLEFESIQLILEYVIKTHTIEKQEEFKPSENVLENQNSKEKG